MRSIPIVLATLALAPATVLAQQTNFEPRDVTRGVLIPGGEGVAGDYDASAISLNPAGIATLGAPGLTITGTVLDEDTTVRGGGGWGAFVALPVPFLRTAIGLGWQQLASPRSWVTFDRNGAPLSPDARQINTTFATGGRLLSFGLTYAHLFWDRTPQYENVDTLHVGLSLRPSRFWAFGGVVRDALAPAGRIPQEKFERSYDLELALRPLADSRVELGGGALIGEGPKTLVDARGRAAFRVYPGLTLFGQFDSVERYFGDALSPIPPTRTERDNRFLFGLTLDAEFVGASYAALTGRSASGGDNAYAGSAFLVRLSGERYPSLVEPTRVMKLKLEGSPSDREFVHTLVWLRAQNRARSVQGVLLIFDRYGVGWGKTEELRDEIARLRAGGKQVFAYLRGATPLDPSTRLYYLASACDRIYLNPGSGIRLAGGSSTKLYYRQLLDNLGVQVEVVKIGEYKSFPEMFTNTQASGPAREEIEALQKDVFQRITERIAADRHLTAEAVRALMEKGYFLPPAAQEAGLVNDLKYEDELEDALKTVYGHKVALAEPPQTPARPDRWRAPQIAIIHVEGEIAPGKSQDIPLWGHITGGQSVAEAIKAARESPSIRAIVLRVDSPGGAVEPSEQIAREVELTHGKKPIVVSMGDVAASGGYMVSARGDRIFAQPSTVTGSIGIFLYKPDLSRLMKLLGITTETIKTSSHADMDSLFRPWTADEQKLAFEGIRFFYDRFLSIVSAGRGVAKERVDEIGRGRVWTGAMAQPLGLVNEMGGLLPALAEAKRRAGMSEDAVAELVQLPREPTSELQKLLKLVGGDDGESAAPPVLRDLLRAVPVSLLWGQRLLARLPWSDVLDPLP